MDLQNLCMGCMEEKNEHYRCLKCGYDENSNTELSHYLPPRTVLQNKYLIGRVLGQGGFAITYLAWDINLGIKLAIKEYYPHDLVFRDLNKMVVANSKADEAIFTHDLVRFLEEARVLARFMEHPNIVSVTDFFQENNTAYLVMHYIEGVTLRHHLNQCGEKLPFNDVMEIIMPVMDALKVIHEAGQVHRDISPENIIISQTGRIVLIDFGAAKRLIDKNDESVSIVMKPGYTPEEQYRSKGIQGPWTDVYAVAATIYRSITGKLPPNSLDRLSEDTLIPPSEFGVEINPKTEKALLKALSVQVSKRFSSVTEFQKALMHRDSELTGRQNKPMRREINNDISAQHRELDQIKDMALLPDQKSKRAYTTLGDVSIGRAHDNIIVVEDESISRYHAKLFSRYGKWFLADLDSTHGTFLNGEKIDRPVELTSPASINLSDVILLHFDGENIKDEQGKILQVLNYHTSFSERWIRSGKIVPGYFIEKFIKSFDKLFQMSGGNNDLININIGRLADNDLVFEHDYISRYHARIFFYENKWYIVDLQSTHGTLVNNILIRQPVELRPADVITLSGVVEFIFTENGIILESGEVIYELPKIEILTKLRHLGDRQLKVYFLNNSSLNTTALFILLSTTILVGMVIIFILFN